MKILYVEDNRHDADLTRYHLARQTPEHQIKGVATLGEARASLAAEPFDLALLDMHLPDGSGLELLADIRAEGLPLAVVILTGWRDEEATVAALKTGADDYLVKSGNYLSTLGSALEAALGRFRAEADRHARSLTILYLEQSESDAELTRRHLERYSPHLRLSVVHTVEEILRRLPEDPEAPLPCDVLLLDYRQPGMNALDLLKILYQERGLHVPVVLVTGHGAEEVAARALRLGASDYLVKNPGYLFRLPAALENAHHRFRLAREEAALRRSLAEEHATRGRLEAILTSLSDPLIATDAQGRISHLNSAAEELLGVSLQKVSGDPIASAVPEPPLSAALERFRASGEQAMTVDLLLHDRRHGEVRSFQGRLSAVRGIDGTPSGFILLLNDVTRERELDRMKSAFITTAAHELRTPLTSVLGYAELMEQAEETGEFSPAQKREFLHHILQMGEGLARIVDDLLDLGEMEGGRPIPLDRVPCPLAALVGETVERWRREGTRHTLETVFPDEPLLVWADARRIGQVLDSLLGNAVKYAPAGGTVRVEATPLGRDVEISVTDQGIGMTPAQLKSVFNSFYRADTSTTAVGGLGVGLSVAKGIIEAHGGSIRVESARGGGTRVSFTLPLLSCAS